jgi:hypothetical protein
MGRRYAMVRHDELWVRSVLAESRVNFGEAVERGREIAARNRIEDRALHARLQRQCEEAVQRIRRSIAAMRDARVRCVVTATDEDFESTIAITLDGVSVVSTPETAALDYALLKSLLPPATRHTPHANSPLLWRNGSAAVLLHEAIGHATEHGHAPLAWPSWLRVRDAARAGRIANLIAGEAPAASRRESFRDAPLPRMTNLVVEQVHAPFELPDERVEIELVAGGAYEPLTEMVTINVAVSSAGPFTIRASRRAISRSLIGAGGNPIRYPGVICSREGQELYVGSYAPLILTTELA